MKKAAKAAGEPVMLREEGGGVGMVVENVAWGPRGPWVAAAALIGWVVRVGLVVMGMPFVLTEMKGWSGAGYHWLLQCVLYGLCALAVVALLWLLATNPCHVRKDDVLQVSPKEALTWTWCSHCRLLRPPGAIHCYLCHRCIDRIHHHCVMLWRCIGRKTLPAFILVLGVAAAVMVINCLMIYEPTITFRGTFGNYIVAFPLLFLLVHSILSLDGHHPWSPPQVYPSSAFVARASNSYSSTAPFTFSFSDITSRRGDLLRMTFRPRFSGMTQLTARKIKECLQCPNSKCQAVANPFWLIGGSDGAVECNLCEAVFPLPLDTEDTLLNRDFMAVKDALCLLRESQVPKRPRVVFVLDSAVAELRVFIHSWATASQGLPDVEVLCYGTRTCCTYVEGKVLEEKADQCYSLGATVDRGRREVAAHGGRLVFISSRDKHGLKMDALEALVLAASQVTLNLVCVSSLGLDMNPLLQPLVLHHQERGGGWTRVVERPKDVQRLVRSGLFLFRGVRARGRVRWTSGVEMVNVSGRGVAPTQGQEADSFCMACLDQRTQVELSLKVDPDTVLHRRRLSDPEDNTVYFQLKLMYTTNEGKAALAVYNRAFSVD